MNGIKMQEDSSMTILDVARKHGIDIPTLCFLKRDDCNFTHKPASCRVCVVEIKGRRNLMPSCATYIEEGMEIYTNSYKVRQERKNVLGRGKQIYFQKFKFQTCAGIYICILGK